MISRDVIIVNLDTTHPMVKAALAELDQLEQRITELETPKTCNTCSFDHCGCSVQDDILRYDPDATFDKFGCTAHELNSVPVDDQSRILTLEAQASKIHAALVTLRRKHGIGIYCCSNAESSNGWYHNGNCKNWVLVY